MKPQNTLIIIILIALISANNLQAQSVWDRVANWFSYDRVYVREGNELYADGQYGSAEKRYENSLDINPNADLEQKRWPVKNR